MLSIIIVGAMFFFSILYYIVKSDVEDGTLKALIQYEKIKNQENKTEQIKS